MLRFRKGHLGLWASLGLLALSFLLAPLSSVTGSGQQQGSPLQAQPSEKPKITVDVTATGNFANIETFELEKGITVPIHVLPLTQEGTPPESPEDLENLPFEIGASQTVSEWGPYALLPDEKYSLNIKVTSTEDIEWVKVYEGEKLLATLKPAPQNPKEVKAEGIEWGGGSPWFEIKVVKLPITLKWFGWTIKVLALQARGLAFPKVEGYFYEPLNQIIARTCEGMLCCKPKEYKLPPKQTKKVKVVEILERPKVELEIKVKELLLKFNLPLDPSIFQPGPPKDKDEEVEVVITPTSPPPTEVKKEWEWYIGASGTEWSAKCELVVQAEVQIIAEVPMLGIQIIAYTGWHAKWFDAGRWRWKTRQIVGAGWIEHECTCPRPPCNQIPSQPPGGEGPSPQPPSQPPQPEQPGPPPQSSQPLQGEGSSSSCGCGS